MIEPCLFIKYNLSGEVMKKILVIVAVLALFPVRVMAQDALCFMEWHGQIIDLTSNVCSTSNKINAAKLNPISVSALRFTDTRIEQTTEATSLEVKGIVTNDSNKVSSLSLVKFNVVNQRNGLVLASDTAVVEAGRGIGPGEQIAFRKTISSKIVGGNVTLSDLRVEITNNF